MDPFPVVQLEKAGRGTYTTSRSGQMHSLGNRETGLSDGERQLEITTAGGELQPCARLQLGTDHEHPLSRKVRSIGETEG